MVVQSILKNWSLAVLLTILSIGCSEKPPGDGSDGLSETIELELFQASFSEETGTFIFYNTPSTTFKVKESPADADWSRWSMLHDGSRYRLFVFRQGSDTTLYVFTLNTSESAFIHGFESDETVEITGAPDDADTTSFSMLYDGNVNRLYFKSKNYDSVHQFGLNVVTGDYEYGYRALDEADLNNMPSDIDMLRWDMYFDGENYRLLAMRKGYDNLLYQFSMKSGDTRFEFGNSTENTRVLDSLPEVADYSGFSVLHDGGNSRFYFHSVLDD